MSAGRPRPGTKVHVLARLALGLYPPAWRARYADEVLALLAESGAGSRAAAALAWHAVPAWACPPRHLYDRRERMRASVGTVAVAWALLAGLAAVFNQLTQAQGQSPAQQPAITWSYWIFDASLAVSVVAAALGGVPLWLMALRRARRARRRTDAALLLAAVVVPAAYLAAVAVVGRLAGGHGGVGPGWFLAVVLLGFAAALASSAGPALALRRLRPHGPVLVLAARAAYAAAVSMSVAGVASAVAAIGLCLWAPGYAGYHLAWPLAIYLPAVLVAGAVAVVSARRGARAARPDPSA